MPIHMYTTCTYIPYREDPINIEEGANDPQSTGPTIVGNDLDQLTTFTNAPDEHPRLGKLHMSTNRLLLSNVNVCVCVSQTLVPLI